MAFYGVDINIIIGTMLGGLISGLIGYILERLRIKNELRTKHFEDIKKNCLQPLRTELMHLLSSFEFNESSSLTPESLKELIDADPKWWESFSLKERIGNIPLFNDLRNHFVKLHEKLCTIDTLVISKYPEFIENAIKLSEAIHSDKRLQEISSKLKSAVPTDISFEVFKAVFFIAIGYEKGSWPNIYGKIVKLRDKDLIFELGKQYGNLRCANDLRKISEEVRNVLCSCMEMIDEIMLKTKLEGSCKYI